MVISVLIPRLRPIYKSILVATVFTSARNGTLVGNVYDGSPFRPRKYFSRTLLFDVPCVFAVHGVRFTILRVPPVHV